MNEKLSTRFITRQYMLSQDFELYYYSDAQMTQVPVHAHDYYEFYFFLEGDVEMHIGSAVYPLRHGNVIVIPPGTRHQAVQRQAPAGAGAPPYRRFVLWLSRDYLQHLEQLSRDYTYLLQKCLPGYVYRWDDLVFNSLQAKVFSLLEEIHADRFGREARVSLGIADLLLTLNRTVYEQEHASAQQAQGTDLYESAVRYIETHIHEPLTLDILADRLHASKYHVAHLFKEKMGISLHRYITDKRLSLCRDALLDGIPAGEACRMCGFSDYSSFYRAFMRRYGVSPSNYFLHFYNSGTSY